MMIRRREKREGKRGRRRSLAFGSFTLSGTLSAYSPVMDSVVGDG